MADTDVLSRHARDARDARRAALGALAAELGHELQGPMNLFRLVTDRAARGERLDEEDVSLLREELERLSRVNARLRRLAQLALTRASHAPRAVVEQALAHFAPALRAAIELEIAGGDAVRIECDAAVLGLALGELVDNALAARAARVGVRFSLGEKSGFCVWDDGPGFAEEAARALAWGTTSKAGAAGLGLTLALRAARAHGFSLDVARSAMSERGTASGLPSPLTEVWLLIPARELIAGTSKLPR